jgi:thiol-disulfide isomerase/thioredoxin
MYNRGPTQLPTPPSDTPTPSAYPLLQALASQAARPPAPTQCLTSPLQISTNPSSFNSLRSSHRAMIVFFTSETCIPCRSIKATFLEIAQSRTSGKNTRGRGAAFVEVDMGTGMGGVVAHEWGVNSTPTFLFFLDGQKVCR